MKLQGQEPSETASKSERERERQPCPRKPMAQGLEGRSRFGQTWLREEGRHWERSASEGLSLCEHVDVRSKELRQQMKKSKLQVEVFSLGHARCEGSI